MISMDLSSSALSTYDRREFTYEIASELCDFSSRCFGAIVKRKTALL